MALDERTRFLYELEQRKATFDAITEASARWSGQRDDDRDNNNYDGTMMTMDHQHSLSSVKPSWQHYGEQETSPAPAAPPDPSSHHHHGCPAPPVATTTLQREVSAPMPHRRGGAADSSSLPNSTADLLQISVQGGVDERSVKGCGGVAVPKWDTSMSPMVNDAAARGSTTFSPSPLRHLMLHDDDGGVAASGRRAPVPFTVERPTPSASAQRRWPHGGASPSQTSMARSDFSVSESSPSRYHWASFAEHQFHVKRRNPLESLGRRPPQQQSNLDDGDYSRASAPLPPTDPQLPLWENI